MITPQVGEIWRYTIKNKIKDKTVYDEVWVILQILKDESDQTNGDTFVEYLAFNIDTQQADNVFYGNFTSRYWTRLA